MKLDDTERQFTAKMDYIVWHQDLVTSAPVSDLEIFRVPDEGLFLAAAALDRHEPRRKQQSTLFKWNRDHFTVYQSLYTLGAYCWQHFVIGKRVNFVCPGIPDVRYVGGAIGEPGDHGPP